MSEHTTSVKGFNAWWTNAPSYQKTGLAAGFVTLLVAGMYLLGFQVGSFLGRTL